jgi:glycosyltransferase involved in cell wall biosynthesis
MKLSIITVCYNSSATIRDTIESVLGQKYQDIEYIIIDGNSKDGTIEIVKEYGDRVSIFISEPDLGIYDAMNKGIRVASGDVIGFLNSDDFYSNSSALSRLTQHMIMEGTDSVYADLVIVDPIDLNKTFRYYDSSKFNRKKLRYGCMPAHPTILVKRHVYLQHGLFSLDYKIAADFEIIVRFYHSKRVSYAYLPAVVVKMRSGGISTKGIKNSWILNREMVNACRINGLKTSLPILALKMPEKLMQLYRIPKRVRSKSL